MTRCGRVVRQQSFGLGSAARTSVDRPSRGAARSTSDPNQPPSNEGCGDERETHRGRSCLHNRPMEPPVRAMPVTVNVGKGPPISPSPHRPWTVDRVSKPSRRSWDGSTSTLPRRCARVSTRRSPSRGSAWPAPSPRLSGRRTRWNPLSMSCACAPGTRRGGATVTCDGESPRDCSARNSSTTGQGLRTARRARRRTQPAYRGRGRCLTMMRKSR